MQDTTDRSSEQSPALYTGRCTKEREPTRRVFFSESSLTLAGLDSQEWTQIRFGASARMINLSRLTNTCITNTSLIIATSVWRFMESSFLTRDSSSGRRHLRARELRAPRPRYSDALRSWEAKVHAICGSSGRRANSSSGDPSRDISTTNSDYR
jgi:hypothetical protein